MKMNFTRRRFLTSVGVTTGAALAGRSLFNIEKVFATTGPYVRPNVNGTNANLASYVTGITNMKALSVSNPSDPRGWSYQAAIHGTVSGMMADWNTCQHGPVNFFWAWHRIYLYWFERIVRSQSGDSTWALPYWDWQANPTLPAMFQNTGNPTLHVAARNASINNGSAGVGNQTPGVNNAFAQPIFEGSVGADAIMQYPHNNIHVNVGGIMGNTATAAQDPIFYVHHANVDRLWNLWLAQGGLQSDPTTDPVWEGQTFGFFDENANAVTMTPCDVLRAALQLNYMYEGEPPQVNQYCGNPQLCTASYQTLIDGCIQKPPFYLKPQYGYGYGYYQFPITYQLGQEIYGYIKNPFNTLYLTHYGVTCPTQPGIVWDVYVGLPLGTKPSHDSPYYVGSYGMYGAGVADQPPDGNAPASFSFPVNNALAEALKKQKKTLDIPVTFFPTSTLQPSTFGPLQRSTVTIQQAQLALQTVSPTDTSVGKVEQRKMVASTMTHRER